MALVESQVMLYQVSYFLMAVVYPIWFISLIWKADKDPKVDIATIVKQESS